MVYRVYVEKKPEYAVEAGHLLEELRMLLGLDGLKTLRLLQRYDVEGVSEELFARGVSLVFSEPPVDRTFEEMPSATHALAVEYLPGQFDQRADSAAECLQLISQGERPLVRTARIYLLEGALDAADMDRIRRYIINPVEARQASLDKPATLRETYARPDTVETLEGFTDMPCEEFASFVSSYGLAMDADDLAFCQEYFCSIKRNPTITELRMIDTYWSDHCRHTTFLTELSDVWIEDPQVQKSYALYQALRQELERQDRPMTLMDIATIGAKALKQRGILQNLDESDEINACSVKIKVDNDGKPEDWLLLFKNETHNHPTEIEPFGGAATCIGGAIRDPLANRGYVYQAMRITGAGNPLAPMEETIPGKLPQRKLVTTAAAGYSSYGNQIGLATGFVKEIYHPGFAAKRMELGAVVGAVPEAQVRREIPAPGDIVVLLGGRTGRDGCGGATGSSKAHSEESLATCGAEVQKGNPPMERKLQRLFRTPEATKLIKRCNDFGAGGVSVAIGELADGLEIDLNAVPLKYEGLDGTELAISESQERMAVVIAAEDWAKLASLAEGENLEATRVAVVTEEPRLRMLWNGRAIVDIDREFLNSNGAPKEAAAHIRAEEKAEEIPASGSLEKRMKLLAGSLAHCSQKGLIERFDATIGAASVLMPLGGARQLSPAQAMVAKIPVFGETTTCSGMAYGYDPIISSQSPYRGAYLAVVDSVAKLVVTGFARKSLYLTFQEYFERLRDDALRWGKPLASLLGALQAQMDLGIASIGGKDSMSGSFEELDVPPTLVSFAVGSGSTKHIITPEIKAAGNRLALLDPEIVDGLPTSESLLALWDTLHEGITSGKVLSAYVLGRGGLGDALLQMSAGNAKGASIDAQDLDFFEARYGSVLLELADDAELGVVIGRTTEEYAISVGAERIDMAEIEAIYLQTLAGVFPYTSAEKAEEPPTLRWEQRAALPSIALGSAPRAFIPVFPGTNCEYDTARALQLAGAQADVLVIRNSTPQAVTQSVEAVAERIHKSQMIVLPGGFSGGDEPEGSAKLIAAFFRNPQVADAVMALLEERGGLMLGICNGFQALVKLGLLPYGRILPLSEKNPTLTYNAIGRHQSCIARIRVASVLSPWMGRSSVDDVYTVAVSHGEGRFVAQPDILEELKARGQIASQYVDLQNRPSMDGLFNPNGSVWAIEGITSRDGRIFGRMGHTERTGAGVYKNIPDKRNQELFEAGVDYFK